MSFPKIILFGGIALFALIAALGIVKKMSHSKEEAALLPEREKIEVINGASSVKEEPISLASEEIAPIEEMQPLSKMQEEQKQIVSLEEKVLPSQIPIAFDGRDDFPEADRIFKLFTTGPSKFPIVETVTFSTNVPWHKGKPAWISDYASHYSTSRHFIARSLNGKPDYINQKISNGQLFNVFRTDKKINFYLLIDISRCKMAFYYIDLLTSERVLMKTYRIGLGRLNPQSPSGSLTPLGKYTLGDKIGIYKPGSMGFFHDQKVEMIQVFGTRWLPFKDELEGASASARGYGIHGAPWRFDPKQGQFIESRDVIGKYDSDGCIRLSLEDIEELFSIVITKPTIVEIVKDFHQAKLPGVEAKIY